MARPAPPPDSVRYRRNPLLLVGWDGPHLVVEHVDTMRRFRVDANVARLLSLAAEWSTAEDLADDGRPVGEEELSRLVESGLLERSAEAEVSPATYWSAVDLAVQRRMATGGYREDLARARGRPAPPAFKARHPGPVTSLPKPGSVPGSLAEVLGRRRSIRAYGERPLRLEELSALLHHSARVQRTASHGLLGEVVMRPYASAGGRSELELYVVANHVEGLATGAYHYDPRAHELLGLAGHGRPGHQDDLNRQVHAATGGALSRDPPAIVVVTAVFARIMWKYRGIGLSLIYQDTGCLIQTLYLVATALGLAPCAVGAGDEAANARWLGLDPMVESQVGCFLVGPRRHDADLEGGS